MLDMKIAAAQPSDVQSAVRCLVEAFADDPQTIFFLSDDPQIRPALLGEFFTILLEVRLALGAPVLVLKREDGILGVAMGYDTSRPEWPSSFGRRWAALQQRREGMASRFERADHIIETYAPPEPHFYLGVLGVHPLIQRQGAGVALIEAFCSLSTRDPASRGLFLETANRENSDFYQRRGFRLLGQGDLEPGVPLLCLYRPNALPPP